MTRPLTIAVLVPILLIACDSQQSHSLHDTTINNGTVKAQDTLQIDTTVHLIPDQAPIDSFLLSADSVIITSFAGNVLYAPADSGGLMKRETAFSKEPLEKKVLTRDQIDKLHEVIFGPPYKSVSIGADCYNPHHSIYVYHGKSECDLEICFECSGIRTCKELHGRLPTFDDQRWTSLEKLFKKFGIKKNMHS